MDDTKAVDPKATKNPKRVSHWQSVQSDDLVETTRLVKAVGLPVLRPTIRSSGISMFRKCPREYMYRYRLGLETTKYKSAFQVGHYYHAMMAALFSGRTIKEAVAATRVGYDTYVQEVKEQVDVTGMLPWGESFEAMQRTLYKDLSFGVALAQYAWGANPLHTPDWKVEAVEELIEVKCQGVATPIRVRVDVLLRDRRTGELWFVDHKTTSLDPKVRAVSLEWDMQPRLYRLALHTRYEGTPEKIVGVIHNICWKPQIRQKLGEEFGAYVQRIFKSMLNKEADFNPYLRSHIRFTGPPLDEELLIAIKEASRASSCRIHLGRFPRNASSCHGQYHNSPCGYLDLCQNSIHAWRGIIDRRFEIVSRDEADERNHG